MHMVFFDSSYTVHHVKKLSAVISAMITLYLVFTKSVTMVLRDLLDQSQCTKEHHMQKPLN